MQGGLEDKCARIQAAYQAPSFFFRPSSEREGKDTHLDRRPCGGRNTVRPLTRPLRPARAAPRCRRRGGIEQAHEQAATAGCRRREQ